MSGEAHSVQAGYSGSTAFRWYEAVPFVVAIAFFFAMPDYLSLGSRILIFILFALSLDLVLGFGGIITLGHSAFLGTGAYTAGFIGAYSPVSDPILQLIGAMIVAGAMGLATGAIVLRTKGLTLIMLTLAFSAILLEAANKASGITGGTDGLTGIQVGAVLGRFEFDLYGQTGYLYCLGVLAVCWFFVRRLVHSPFGTSLTGIRDNAGRMYAIGAPVYPRLVVAYGISAAIAGAAGALLTQINQLVGLDVLGFEPSGEVLVMLILGGVGRIYGAFIGPAVFLVLQDLLAKQFPEFWYFGVGVVLLIVVFVAPSGLIGLFAKWTAAAKRRGHPK
jgi:branched-chain amino acid transport system permease protein